MLEKENLSPLSKDMDGRHNLAHNFIDAVDRANREICISMLRCSVKKPESSYAQSGFFAMKSLDEIFNKLPM